MMLLVGMAVCLWVRLLRLLMCRGGHQLYTCMEPSVLVSSRVHSHNDLHIHTYIAVLHKYEATLLYYYQVREAQRISACLPSVAILLVLSVLYSIRRQCLPGSLSLWALYTHEGLARPCGDFLVCLPVWCGVGRLLVYRSCDASLPSIVPSFVA